MTLPGLDIQVAAWSALRGRDQATATAAADAAKEGADSGEGSRLKAVATQFEALFYNQLLRSMRETVPDNGFWGQSGGAKIYRQMHDQELSDRLASRGGLGVADLIVDQFRTALDRENDDAVEAPLALRQRQGLAAYGSPTEQTGPMAAATRLRRRAEDIGGATADTLARFQGDILAAARETGVDPALVLAVAVRESGGDPAALSHRGARGLMQLMPATAREMGVTDPGDPSQNLRGGSRYLARMLDRFGGDLDLALAAYNAGPGTVERAGGRVPDYPETQRYVKAVKELSQRLGAGDGTNLVRESTSDQQPGTQAR